MYNVHSTNFTGQRKNGETNSPAINCFGVLDNYLIGRRTSRCKYIYYILLIILIKLIETTHFYFKLLRESKFQSPYHFR